MFGFMKLTICGFEVAYEQVPFHSGRNVSKISQFFQKSMDSTGSKFYNPTLNLADANKLPKQ
jgi:hypothetical protein